MCGIYFSSNKFDIDKKFKLRGPDYLNFHECGNFSFSHSLLSLTGEFTPQPVKRDGVILMFNGQIYNYDRNKFKSDSYHLLDLYLNRKLDLLKLIDGEYAILIYDTNNSKILFITDIFGTKPLYYSTDDDQISVSSLRSTLANNKAKFINKCSANTIYTYDVNKKSLSIDRNYFKFNLDQFKNSFDDWNSAFLQSIKKRFQKTNGDILLPLSSGLDSGAIACALDLLKIQYYTYTFIKNENRTIILKRMFRRFLKKPFKTKIKFKYLSSSERTYVKKIIQDNCDDFFYGINTSNLSVNGTEDNGAQGLCYMLSKMKMLNKDIKIIASGQGGDEIYSRDQSYTFCNPNPESFDSNLEKVFPWENFYDGAQMSYLSKEESIGGGYGMETRYPFLDKSVVQEYLNLIPILKNKFNKSPIHNFLIENQYPFYFEKKFGFNP